MTLETVERLAAALGVRTGSLLGPSPIARPDSQLPACEVLAYKLAAIRDLFGWSYEALQERSGVHMSILFRIEHQQVSPDVTTLARIATTLNVTVDELLS